MVKLNLGLFQILFTFLQPYADFRASSCHTGGGGAVKSASAMTTLFSNVKAKLQKHHQQLLGAVAMALKMCCNILLGLNAMQCMYKVEVYNYIHPEYK